MEPLLEGLFRSLGGSEANFLELCFGRFPYGNFHTKATSKKFRPPSGNFRPNPPELPRSPSMSFSSREAGWRTVLLLAHETTTAAKLRLSSVPIQPPKSQNGNDYETTTSPPDHHREATIQIISFSGAIHSAGVPP